MPAAHRTWCGLGKVQMWCVQVLMAIAARLSLHIMYEFTAFMNMWAVQVLNVSGGVAAQVNTVCLTSMRVGLRVWSVSCVMLRCSWHTPCIV